MNIRPLRDQVLVKLDPLPCTTAGGLHIPEASVYRQDNRPNGRWGTVLAVGPGKYDKRGNRIPVPHAPGDRVYVNAWVHDSVKRGVFSSGEDDRDIMIAAEDLMLQADESEAAE